MCVCDYAVPLLLVCWDAVAAKAGGEAAPAASCRTLASVAVDKQSHILSGNTLVAPLSTKKPALITDASAAV